MGIGVLRGSINVLTQATRKLAATPWYLAGGVAAANCVGAWQAKGAASLAASRVNLANPGTYDLADGVAPSWASATGWTFDGTSQTLKTNIVPSVRWSLIGRFSGGSITGTRRYQMVAGAGGTESYRFYIGSTCGDFTNRHSCGLSGGGGYINNPPALASGVLAIAGTNYFWDGSREAEYTNSSGSPNEIRIGSDNSSGDIAGSFYMGDIIAVAIYNVDISSQVASITTAMNAI